MKSRWHDSDAAEAVRRWGNLGEDVALRLYSARLIGSEPDLVLHGGGNVSLKHTARTEWGEELPVVLVKASGGDLAELEPVDLPASDLSLLRRLRALNALDDTAMVRHMRRCLLDPDAPTPSIECLMHAFLPHRFVDHSHADVILALTNQPDPEALIREALGSAVAVLPYVRPGFELALAVAEIVESQPGVPGVVLVRHGLVTFGESARESYERHIELVDRCEGFLAGRGAHIEPRADIRTESRAAERAAQVAPILRGLLAEPISDEDKPHSRSILDWRAGHAMMDFVNGNAGRALGHAPAVTGDHVIRAGPFPLFVPEPDWDGGNESLHRQLGDAVEAYRRQYQAYVAAHGGATSTLRSAPKVVLLPGAGAFCWGPDRRRARIAGDITEHTVAIKSAAHAVGTYQALEADHLFDMEFRAQQRAKVASGASLPLRGHVVAISGGAGAIGVAVAEACGRAGACVALTDLDAARLSQAVELVNQRLSADAAHGVVMDVTDEGSVHAGFDDIMRTFGGVDVVVPNAGIAHVSPVDEMDVNAFRRVMEVNAVGYLLFIREGVRRLKQQGLGGHVIINASKNVFGPGKDFGAYSASKAAGHQLGKVAAIELAPFGIRVNMINADAVFGDAQTPSGLWQEVGPGRAKSRNLTMNDLPEFYRERNLLKVRVHGRHVGNAVVFFATNQTPTTGATLPVDGGVVEAFPR